MSEANSDERIENSPTRTQRPPKGGGWASNAVSEDQTFCSRQPCREMACPYNPNHIRQWRIPHSYARYAGTERCMLRAHMAADEDRRKRGEKA